MGSERTVFLLLIATCFVATCSHGMAVNKQEVYQLDPLDDMSFEENNEEAMNSRISFGKIFDGSMKNAIRDNWEEKDLLDDKKVSRKKRSPRTSNNPYYPGNSYDRNTRQWGNILGKGLKLGRRSSDDDDDDFDDYMEKRRLGLVLGNGLLVGNRPASHNGHHQNHPKSNTAQRDSSSYPNAQTRPSPNHTGRHGHSNPVTSGNSNSPASRSNSNSYPAQRSSPNNIPSRASSYNSGYGASPQNPNNGYNRVNGHNTAQRNSYDTAQRNPYNTPQRASYNIAQRSVHNSPSSNPHNSPLSNPYNARQINSYNPQQRTYPYNVYVDIDDLHDSDEYERRRAQQMLSQATRSLATRSQPVSNNQQPNYLLPYKTYRTYIDSSGEVETDSVEVYPNPYAAQPNTYNQRTYG
ncbi:hypothetical protein ACJMK2_012157 [Sinanodonta woodiana]|uniref:Uncharacterized protein n=1 Tax=Sinanodonta woodiana TaxID=1069815 RepID=A0ABD3V7L1_SINWO